MVGNAMQMHVLVDCCCVHNDWFGVLRGLTEAGACDEAGQAIC